MILTTPWWQDEATSLGRSAATPGPGQWHNAVVLQLIVIVQILMEPRVIPVIRRATREERLRPLGFGPR